MLAFEEYLLEELEGVGRRPQPDDFVLYPEADADARGLLDSTEKRCASHTVHRWWYRQLEAAGIVGKGVRSGLNMHRARHTFATDVPRAHRDVGAVQHLRGTRTRRRRSRFTATTTRRSSSVRWRRWQKAKRDAGEDEP